MYHTIYIYIYVYIYVCMYVCIVDTPSIHVFACVVHTASVYFSTPSDCIYVSYQYMI